MAGEHQPAKILVFGQQNPILAIRLLDQFAVIGALHVFTDC
ncbi:MAG: hypothetical protein CNIPEHKO_00414 [Anaerolineales bacterium]|nr:hypothetical protein [Anaerolineales bacterium]